MSECDPRDVAIKSFFLGPQSENCQWLRAKWIQILDNWLSWRQTRFPGDGESISESDRGSYSFNQALDKLDHAVHEVLKDLEDETPKFTPRYIGHMVSDVSLPAFLGHVCALMHNPNNTSREVSRVTSRLEEEAIADLGRMLGFCDSVRGHFTSGGTIANFEALWRAIVAFDAHLQKNWDLSFLKSGPWQFASAYQQVTGQQFSGPVVLVPNHKHFSWEKAVSLMGLGDHAFWGVELDEDGRLSLSDLRTKLDRARALNHQVIMVVSVAGTTEMGEVDPIAEVQNILEDHPQEGFRIWHHVDAAYGGYFASMLDGGELEARLAPTVAKALRAIRRVDSVTLDPHKLGYVPYACGAFFARDEEQYRTRNFSASYLLDSNQSRWGCTLEGSRSGAGITATWLANRSLGLDENGYGRLLGKGIEARDAITKRLRSSFVDFLPVFPSDLNILCFCLAREGSKLSEVNRRSEQIFKLFERSPRFSVSKTVLHMRAYRPLLARLARERQIELDTEEWFMLRLVLMNPFLISQESKVDLLNEFVQELRMFAAGIY